MAGPCIAPFLTVLSLDTDIDKENNGDEGEDEDRPVFSLVSGSYRQAKRFGGKTPRSSVSLRRLTSSSQAKRRLQQMHRTAVHLHLQPATRTMHSQNSATALPVSAATILSAPIRLHFNSRSTAHFLQERSYQGLDPRLGQDTPSVLEQGRSGIARAYEDADLQT